MTFISAYLKIRKQKTRIKSAFTDYMNVLFGVPRRSILGPILFIIFLTDLFYIYNDLYYASYTDDTTRYLCRQNSAEAIEFLELTINNIFTCFKQNRLVANSDRSNFLISPYKKISLKILYSIVKSSLCKGLLGITNDSELIFHKRIML